MEVENSLQHPHPIRCQVSLLSRPDGSSLFCNGDTSVMAAVYGPAEVKISKEQMDKATVEVVYKPKIGMPGCADRAQERDICQVCESIILTALHPRSSISVIIQELKNNGCYLACCINASCMALLDAAVPLKNTAAAVACCIDENGQIKFDATRKDEEEAKACMTFAFDSKNSDVILAVCTGSYSLEQYQACLSSCKQAAKSVFQTYRESVSKKLKK